MARVSEDYQSAQSRLKELTKVIPAEIKSYLVTFNSSLSEITGKLADIKNDMIYIGYSKAEVNMVGFFAIWVEFIQSIKICQSTILDKEKATKKKLQNSANTLKNSIILSCNTTKQTNPHVSLALQSLQKSSFIQLTIRKSINVHYESDDDIDDDDVDWDE